MQILGQMEFFQNGIQVESKGGQQTKGRAQENGCMKTNI